MSGICGVDCIFMELYKVAMKIIGDLALVKREEEVLVLADTAIDLEVAKSLSAMAYASSAESVMVIYETRKEVNIEPPENAKSAMKASDVIISLPLMYILRTRAYYNVLQAGARILEVTGITADMLIRLVGYVDYEKMCLMGNKLTELTRKARYIKMATRKGTELKFENDPARPVFHNDGILSEGEFTSHLVAR